METALTPWGMLALAGSDLRNVLLYGPPGTGKTFLAQRCGVPDGQPVYRVVCTEDTPAAELRGHFIPRSGEFVWHDGPAMLAYRHGGRLVVDEITRATDDALSFLLGILDGNPVTLPDDTTIERHPQFTCWATSNDGPERLTDALADRLTARVLCDTVNPEALRLLRTDLRAAVTVGTDATGISYREAAEYQRLTNAGLPQRVVAKIIWGDRGRDVLTGLSLA